MQDPRILEACFSSIGITCFPETTWNGKPLLGVPFPTNKVKTNMPTLPTDIKAKKEAQAPNVKPLLISSQQSFIQI